MYQYIKDKRFEIVSSVFNCIYSDFCEELGRRGRGGGDYNARSTYITFVRSVDVKPERFVGSFEAFHKPKGAGNSRLRNNFWFATIEEYDEYYCEERN